MLIHAKEYKKVVSLIYKFPFEIEILAFRFSITKVSFCWPVEIQTPDLIFSVPPLPVNTDAIPCLF